MSTMQERVTAAVEGTRCKCGCDKVSSGRAAEAVIAMLGLTEEWGYDEPGDEFFVSGEPAGWFDKASADPKGAAEKVARNKGGLVYFRSVTAWERAE